MPTPAVQKLLTRAEQFGYQRRKRAAGDEELLLSLLWQRESLGAQILHQHGLTFEAARDGLGARELWQTPRSVESIHWGDPVPLRREELDGVLTLLPHCSLAMLPLPGTPAPRRPG